MSFILDALKKSESERQQQHLPGFADIPGRSVRASTPVWIWPLAALLLVNAVGLTVLVMNRDPAARPPRAESEPPAANSAAPAAPPGVTNRAGAQDSKPPTPAADTPAAAVQSTPPTQQAVSQTALPAAAAAPATTQAPATSAALPTLMDLRISGEIQLPDLHLDIHVYSQTPGDRFVFINMAKYREQSRLAEGPLVREIRNDGVVLEYRGREFLLPRE